MSLRMKLFSKMNSARQKTSLWRSIGFLAASKHSGNTVNRRNRENKIWHTLKWFIWFSETSKLTLSVSFLLFPFVYPLPIWRKKSGQKSVIKLLRAPSIVYMWRRLLVNATRRNFLLYSFYFNEYKSYKNENSNTYILSTLTSFVVTFFLHRIRRCADDYVAIVFRKRHRRVVTSRPLVGSRRFCARSSIYSWTYVAWLRLDTLENAFKYLKEWKERKSSEK